MKKVIIISEDKELVEKLTIHINKSQDYFVCGQAFDGEAGLELIKRGDA